MSSDQITQRSAQLPSTSPTPIGCTSFKESFTQFKESFTFMGYPSNFRNEDSRTTVIITYKSGDIFFDIGHHTEDKDHADFIKKFGNGAIKITVESLMLEEEEHGDG